LLIIIFSILTVISTYLAYDDSLIFQREEKDQSKFVRLAVVSHRSNDVKRKYNKDIIWYGLEENDQIYKSDSVFTGEEADAEILFDDGTRINVSESTLVKIDKIENDSVINIERGMITSKIGKNKKLRLKMKNMIKDITGENAEIQYGVDKKGKTKLTVLEGKIELGKGAKKKIIKTNQVVHINKKGKIDKIINLKMKLISPKMASKIYSRKNKSKVSFIWKVLNKKKVKNLSFQLEASFEKNFKKVLLKKKTVKEKIDLLVMEGKRIYWRVKMVGGGKKSTSLKSFKKKPQYQFYQ